MWSNDGTSVEERGRVTSSDVVVMDDRAMAAAMPVPNIASLNVTKSSKVHIGPKFVSVTQNVENREMVKGQFLGLELVSSKHARRLRCSVAVFVCWALIVATGLIVYLIYVALPSQQTRLDIELPLRVYLWNIVKNSSRTERLSCAAALLVLITCITLIVYFTVLSTKSAINIDISSDEWNITREKWLAKPYDNHTFVIPEFMPMMLVIIHHTVSSECTTLSQCAAELRTMQGWYLKNLKYDIPYSFIVGNDGRVYEGRGWTATGAHTLSYNLCTVGIAFTGDYRGERPHHSSVSELQLNRTRLLLEHGVRMGYLRPDFLVVGGKDVHDTVSPGSNLMNAIRLWDNYDHKNRFRGLNCSQMYEKYGGGPLH